MFCCLGMREDPDSKEVYEGQLELAVPSTIKSVIVDNKLQNTFVKHG
jgi:hypothetical protein